MKVSYYSHWIHLGESPMNDTPFEKTTLPHMADLHRFALSLTKNSQQAEDLLQDTYLSAFRFWKKFEEGTNIRGWLYQIMKNISINLYRKQRRSPVGISYEEYHSPVTGTDDETFIRDDTGEKSYEKVFGDEIISSLESLSEKFRNAVLLGDVRELRYDEIARVLDCPIGTVRSRLHRGRKHLMKKLYVYAKNNRYIV